jgi:hypothetical protein
MVAIIVALAPISRMMAALGIYFLGAPTTGRATATSARP